MSKSLDNFFFTRDVLKKYDAEAIRFFFLSKHYRSSIDYNEDLIKESVQAVKNLYSILKELDYFQHQNEDASYAEKHKKLKDRFIEAMDDDFNTAKAISVLFEIVKITRSSKDMNFAHLLVELGQVLGFFTKLEEKLKTDTNEISEELIQLFINYRQLFKKGKNWQMADKIRDDLKSLGIQLKDTPAGTEWEIVK